MFLHRIQACVKYVTGIFECFEIYLSTRVPLKQDTFFFFFFFAHLTYMYMDPRIGWMDELGFYVPSTVFQLFRDDGRVNMKGSMQ